MPTGILTTYDLTQGVEIDIDPVIKMLDPTETPLQSSYGADGQTVLATEGAFEKKVEWQDETLLIPRSTFGAAVASTTTTVITVATGDRLKFSTGEAILIGTEEMRITDYGSTADTLLVTRGHASTTPATHASGADIVNLGGQLPEGSDPEDARAIDRTGRYNMMQIFGPTAVSVSATENVVRKYGLNGTEFDKQAANRAAEDKIKVEQALMYGTRLEDGSAKIRQMGGFTYYITTNVATATEIGTSVLVDQLQAAWALGGRPDRLLLGPVQSRKLSNIDEGDIRLGRMDNGRGAIVDYIDSDFGRLTKVMSRWVRATDAFGFERDQAIVRTLRGWTFQMLAKTGDSVKGMLVCEKSLQFERQRHAFRFNALT